MAHHTPDPAAEQSPGWSTAEKDWSKALHEYVIGRFELVQTAARFWLGTMTTLVGLFSALLVINRGESLAALSVSTPIRVGLYLAVVTVYICAFAAVVMAAQASFGGLALPLPSEREPLSFWRHPWQVTVLQWQPEPMGDKDSYAWGDFSQLRRERANRARTYLHRSRALGIGALVVASVLALIVLALGGFGEEPPAPAYVVVVHGGRVTCGELQRTTDGRTVIGGQELDDVSQLETVTGC